MTDGINYPDGVDSPLIEGNEHHLGPDFDRSVLPPDATKYLDIRAAIPDGYVVKPKNHAGILSCEDGTTLPIDTKASIHDVGYFLYKSGRLPHNPDDLGDDADILAVRDFTSLEETHAKALLKAVDEITRKGFIKVPKNKQITASSVKGRINWKAYAKNVAKNRNSEIPQTVNQDSINNALNQFLKSALAHLNARVTSINDVTSEDVYHRLDQFERVDRVDLSPTLVESIRNIVSEESIPPSRHYYIPALQSALHLIDGSGISFTEGKTTGGKSFMIHTPTEFENYVRNIISEMLRDSPYTVQDGNKKEWSEELYAPNADCNSKQELRPDIIIALDGDVVLLLDAKYTREPSDEDDYKTYTYKQIYNVETAAHVTLPERSTHPSTIECNPLKGKNGHLDLVRLSLNDFDNAESCLGEYLQDRLPRAPPSIG